jgi:hypothetical protein
MKRTLQAINKLKEKGAIGDYAIGGAVASFFYLEATLTEDLYVFIRIDSGKDEIVILSELFDRLAKEGHKEFRKEGIVIDIWPVQFLPATTELEIEALKKANIERIEGEEVRVLSAEYLMAICIQVGRAKDKIRLDQFLSEKCFDEKIFHDIINRHNLTEKYNRIRKAFEV